MPNFIISRSGYCKKCFDTSRPAKDDLYVVWGTAHQQAMRLVCDHDAPFSKKGFVPLIYEKTSVQELESGMYVHYTKTCGMHNCGLLVQESPIKGLELLAKGTINKHTLYVYRYNWFRGMMPVRDWNALVADWKNTGYELDGKYYINP